MPAPPFSAACIILYENSDGISARVYHWNDVPNGTPIPKGIQSFEAHVFNAGIDVYASRTVSTRSALKTAFGQYVDANFPDLAP